MKERDWGGGKRNNIHKLREKNKKMDKGIVAEGKLQIVTERIWSGPKRG